MLSVRDRKRLLNIDEASAGRLCPLSGTALEQGCKQTPGEGKKHDKKFRKHDIQKKGHRKIIIWSKMRRLGRECRSIPQ